MRVTEVVTTRKSLQDFGTGRTEGAVPRYVFRERGSDYSLLLVGLPCLTIDLSGALIATGPRRDLLTFEQKVDSRYRPHVIPVPLGLPAGDAGIKDRVRHSEEHLDVSVEVVVVSGRDEFGKKGPVAGRQLRLGAVCPILGYHLLFIVEVGAEVKYLLSLLAILAGRVGLEGTSSRSKLRSGCESEGGDETPVGSDVLLDHEVTVPV